MANPIPPRRPLTLRDVAEQSGVSEMTVSRVLRARGDVSPATRERVLETARTMGYVPNKIAGSLASSRVNLVAVIIPSMGNLVFPEVLSGISAELEGTVLQPVLGVTDYRPGKEEKVLYEMLSWRPSGMIIAGLEHSDASRAMLASSGVPVIEIMDTDGDPVDCAVGISHDRAGRIMAKQILESGYRKIGFLGSVMDRDHRGRKRLQGLKSELEAAGVQLADEEFYEGTSSIAKGREMTIAMLKRSPDLDFLYYSNDITGVGGLQYCLEQGYDIPGKLGLAGFNAVTELNGLSRKLATVDSCRAEIGRTAARMILDRLDTPQEGETIELTPMLDPGETLRTPG